MGNHVRYQDNKAQGVIVFAEEPRCAFSSTMGIVLKGRAAWVLGWIDGVVFFVPHLTDDEILQRNWHLEPMAMVMCAGNPLVISSRKPGKQELHELIISIRGVKEHTAKRFGFERLKAILSETSYEDGFPVAALSCDQAQAA